MRTKIASRATGIGLRLPALFLSGIMVVLGLATPAPAPAALVELVEGGDGNAPDPNAIDGASLKTDSEIDDLLARADQFAKQGRYDLASTLWQTVIDSSNDLVFTREEWIEKTLEHQYQRYRSVTGDIEGTLAKLPEDGLEGYRIKADGEAKRLLARPGGDGREAALAEIVRRYFLSSVGDDAAFELACRKLDRYEFLPAIRLLDKIVSEYPDSSVQKDEVLLRLGALNARVGDPAKAMEIIEDLRERVTPSIPDSIIDLVEADVKKARGGVLEAAQDGGIWPMVMGSPKRLGLMPNLAKLPAENASEGWAQPWELVLPEGWPELPKEQASIEIQVDVDDPFRAPGRTTSRNSSKKASTNESILADWPKHGWYPSARALFHSGRIYFKNHNRLVCADAATGELRWLGFRNEYPFPPIYNNQRNYGSSTNDESVGRDPRDAREVQSFGDSVHQSMCVVRDKVLTLQGKPVDFTEENVPIAAGPAIGGRIVIRGGDQQQAARFRANRLVAYHARNGKLQWMRTAGEPDAEAPKRSCFAGSPVPYAGLVLVPVLEERGMFLVAIDAEGGATLWRTFLGDEPDATAPGSAIMISVDGGEAYVATGAGLVFSVDAISGAMNWAVRYPRTLVNDAAARQQMQRFRGFGRVNLIVSRFDGWREEMIIPAGNAVIVTPVDFDHVVAFDRRSGTLLWESARQPSEEGFASDYALGVHGGKFYTAGNDVVRCYRVGGGRMLWEATFEAGHGRGALTAAGIYMPSAMNKVIKMSLEDGSVLAGLVVNVEGDQPVGNLYTDGDQLYGFGLRRAYSVAEIDAKEAAVRSAEKAKKAEELADAQAGKDAELAEALKSLDGITGEVDRAMGELAPAFKAAIGGDPTKLELVIKKMELIAGRLEKMPDPSPEVLAANKKRFKVRGEELEAEVSEVFGGLLGDGGDLTGVEKIGALMSAFSERIEAIDPTLTRFGFSDDD